MQNANLVTHTPKKYKYFIQPLKVTRARAENQIQGVQIRRSTDFYELSKEMYDQETMEVRESFYATYLNRKNNVMSYQHISDGGYSATVAEVQMIIYGAIQAGASAIILSHNHPSGNTSPSEPDITLTRRVKEAAKLFNIDLLDHVIVTSSSHYSFAEEGMI